MSLTRDQILDAADLATKTVPVPEWGPGDEVHVRTLSGLDAEGLKDIEKGGNFLGQFAAMVLCDADGLRLFTDDEALMLGGKNNDVLRRICEAAQELNGMTEKAHEETGKN